MATVLPKLKTNKPLQIQIKKQNQKCTINTLTNTLKKLMPNIKEIKITSKRVPKDTVKKKLYIEQVLKPMHLKKTQKAQIKQGLQVKPTQAAKDNLETVEYYPDKAKRSVDLKKIVLQPRHDYKVVAATNKRKRRTPRKDAGSLKKEKTSEISFEDMIPSSIIHKINDLKHVSSDFKNSSETTSDLNKSPTTPSDLKNRLKTVSDLKKASKKTNFKNSLTSNLKNQKTLLKNMPNSSIMNRIFQSHLNIDTVPHSDLKTYNTPHSESETSLCKAIGDLGSRMAGIEDLMADEDLTDEDFMEILTCPSPVWWEDPPDDNYVEEPIARYQNDLPHTKDCTKDTSKMTQPNQTTQNNVTEQTQANVVTTKTFGNKKLIEKRLKLENLLSSLKSSNNTNKIDKSQKAKLRKISSGSDGSEFSVDDEELAKSLLSIEIPINNEKNDSKNEQFRGKFDVETKTYDQKDLNTLKYRNNANENRNTISKTLNKAINHGTSVENFEDINDNPIKDNQTSIESRAFSVEESKATSPRKTNRNSPKKHQLTKYYNLKSKRPRIIKQNPRNKIIIESHGKLNVQKTPEKRLNRKSGDVSKIKKAYLDLLKQNKIENNLTQNQKITNIQNVANSSTDANSNTEANAKIAEENTRENVNTTKSAEDNLKNTEQNNEKESEQKNKTPKNNNEENKIKTFNNIPIILPKLTKIPQNLAIDSPKSMKSGTSDSTDVNSELDTISDTNVQFIDEYVGKKEDFVTVYQIIGKKEKGSK